MSASTNAGLDDLFALPSPPAWRVDWQDLDERFAWIRAMRGVAQDPIWHAEGDVWIHTKLVCEALTALTVFRNLDEDARRICWLGALLHDVAKPYSTQHEDGRVRSRHHSPRGAIHARRLLWRAGVAPTMREQICGLVRHHQLPLHGLSATDAEHRTSAASMRCRLRDLAIVAEADIRGRICDDQQEKLDNIELFGEYARELACFDAPRTFPSDHTRVLFFRKKRPATVEAFDDNRCTVTLLSGLPGAGKTQWRAAHQTHAPVVSMDALRSELGVAPTDDQGRVRQAAIEQAREHLRSERSFCWDATNLEALRRRKIVDLCLQYRARVDIVALESSEAQLQRGNAGRKHPVPQAAIESMLSRWVTPDATEAHSVSLVRRADEPATQRTS